MKLLIVTVVEQFHREIIRLFKQAKIENFSSSEIDGYKSSANLLGDSSWFPGEKSGTESKLIFSFTDDDKIAVLFKLIETFNQNLETNNPIKAVVVPIEKHI